VFYGCDDEIQCNYQNFCKFDLLKDLIMEMLLEMLVKMLVKMVLVLAMIPVEMIVY